MSNELIDNLGEIVATRITVYNLLPYFLDPTATEAYLCRLYELTPEQVAAARAFVLNNLDTVLAQHLKIEERIAAGNPPQVIEQAKKTHAAFVGFQKWLDERHQAETRTRARESSSELGQNGSECFPTWFNERESHAAEGT